MEIETIGVIVLTAILVSALIKAAWNRRIPTQDSRFSVEGSDGYILYLTKEENEAYQSADDLGLHDTEECLPL